MVSIIISAYDNEEYIHTCLDSIMNSCCGVEYEILIGIDNCDKTRDSIYSKKNKYENLRVFFFDEKPGTYIIRNTLTTLAKYDKLIFFDSDDVMSNKLVLNTIKNLDYYDFVKFRYVLFKTDDEIELINRKSSIEYAAGAFGLKKMVFEFLNGFEPWVCAADNEFFWRVEKNKFKIFNLYESPFFYREHNNSLSRNKKTGGSSEVRKKYHHIRDMKIKTNNFQPLDTMIVSNFNVIDMN